MGRLTKSSARQLAAQTPHLGGGGRLWRRTAAAAAGGRAAGLTLSAVRVFARLFSPKLFAVAFVLGGALSAQSAFAFGAVSSVGRFLRGRMRGVGASGFPLSAVRGFLQLFSPKLFAVAFVLCGALSAQSAFAFGAIAAGGSGSNPSHGIAINQATRAGADAEALRLCEVGGADCHLIRRFINLCGIAVADSDATTDLAGIPSGTLATGSQAQAAGFYSRTYPSTSNANTARTQAIIQCTNFGGTSCAAIAGASGCDTTTIPSCPAGQGVDIVESSVCGVCPLVRPIVHTTGPGGTAGVCRAAFNQGECTALDATYHYVNTTGACRVRVAADCTSFTPIYVSASNTCRAAANDEECKAKDPTLEKVGDRCLNICTSGTQVRDTFGGCRAVQDASDCTGTPTPIFVSASTTCRAATNQAECTALTGGSALMFDGGACRDRVASDCAAPNGFFVSASKTCRPATQADCDATTATPILQNGACRAATNQGECSALTGGSALVFDGGACRDRVAGDCAGTTPIFVSASKTCREARQEECTGNTPILDNGACRTRQMNDCPNHAPVLDGGVCRSLQLGDTFGAYYSYERQFVSGGATLRFVNGEFAVNQASPAAAAAAALQACQTRFNNASGTPIRQCEETIVGGFNDMCIDIGSQAGFAVAVFGLGATPAAAAADRIGKFPAGTNFNSATRAGCDCGGTTPIPDGNTCKAAATQAECTAVHAGLVFVSGTGTCRPRTASECTGNTPILGNDGVCRAATKEECAAIPATPVSNNNGGCREATNAGECPSARPFFDNDASGKCRAPHSGDNYGAYYHFTRFGGINNGGISFNHPTQEAANAAAKAACESRRDDFGSGTSACNPHPRVRNGFTQCINTAETGPVRYVGLGATPEAARADRQAQPGSGTAGHNNNNPQAACNCGDGETPDGDNCRPTTQADCTGLRPIFDGGNCRARTPAECPANRPIVDATTGNCREMREVDCTGTTPILDGIACRAAANNAECLFKSRALRLDNDGQSCRAATQADCTGTAAPIFDANSGACRVMIASDCSAPTPDISKGVCVAACAAGTPVRDATSEECRATRQTDCDGTGTPILDGTACRAAVQTDCDGTATPILDGGICRARNAADCTTAAAPALDSTSGNCRAATTAAECPFGLPILDGGVCRAATQADCDATPATPVLDIGGCRAPRAGDTFGAYYTFTAGSQLINGRFVVNQPTPEAAATEARRACEAVRAGSIGGLFGNPSACAPDSSAPNGFNGVCINTGEVGPRRFVGYGATPAAALAARAAQSGNRNVNFPIDACDCSASQIRSGNDCQPRTSAATCTGDTPIFDRGFCREVRAEDCGGNTPIFDGGVCRGARPGQGECTGRTPIADGGACRAAASVEDCAGVNALLLPAGDGSCRPKQQSDCTGLTPILDGGLCRAMQARDCVAPTPFLDLATNQCREAVAADCGGDTPIFDSNTCRAAVQADCDGTGTPDLLNGRCYAACPSGTPVRDSTTRLCRIAEASDCGGGTPVFEGGNCREQRQDECTGTTPILDGGACRGAATDADCGTINIVLVRVSDGSCRERVATDCVAGPTPIFDDAKICRAALSQEECTAKDRALLFETGGTCRLRTQADCTDVQILDGGVCRAIVAADCTDGTPIFEDNKCRAAANQDDCTAKATSLLYIGEGQCRTRVQSDCGGATPFLDATSGECREVTSADCPMAQPILDATTRACRVAANQEECTAKDTILQFDGGACRPRVASDCAATEAFENGFCRTRTSQDCTGATPRFDGGRCFPNSAFATFGAYFDYEAGTGSDRYTTGFIDPLIVNRPTAAQARADALAACQAASASAAANGETITRACAEAATGGFTGCINVATDLSDFSDYFGLGDTPAAARAAREAKHTGNTGTQIAACNCGGATPIADSTSPTLCRAATTQAECTAIDARPIFDDGICRAATNQAECTAIAGNLVFDGGSCRPREARDCTGDTPIFDGGHCFPETSFLHGSYFDFEATSGTGTASRVGNVIHNSATPAQARASALAFCENSQTGAEGSGFTITRQCAEAATFRRCINVGTVDSKSYFGLGDTPAAALAARQAKHPGAGPEGISRCNCGAGMPIVDGSSCRAAANQQECPAAVPRLENGVCQPSNCAANEVFTGSACRVRETSDCTGNTPILDGGICRAARNNAECRAKNPSLGNSSGRCVEVDAQFSAVWIATFSQSDGTNHDFVAIAVNQPTRDAATSKAREACEALDEGIAQIGTCKQFLTPSPSNQCVDLRRAVLTNGDFKYASGIGGDLDAARVNRINNQIAGNPANFQSWRSEGGSDSEKFCDCGGSIGSVASGTGSGTTCRARVSADCGQSTPIFEGGICRAATLAECTTAKPILDNGACRELAAADCAGATPIFENNACRAAASQAECTAKGSKYVFASGGVCRERTKADCTAQEPVLDDTTGRCRARVASDCTGFTPALVDGICQPGMHGAVAMGTIALNISPVNLGALTNPAHPQYSTANGTIQVYGVSRLQASAADARRLALSECGRAASDHRAAVAGQTGQNCHIVSQFAGGVAALWRLATAPYGDHYFSGIATLQINTTTTIATMTMAQNTITTTMTMVVPPTNAELVAAQSAAEAAAKTACDTFAAAQTSTGQTLECQSAAVEVLRTIPAAEICGEGAFLDTAAIPNACACSPGYDTLTSGAGGLPSCSLSANTPRCDNSKGAFLNADATACQCSSGWGALDTTATPQVCAPPQCDGPSAFLHPTSGRCECAEGYDSLRHSVGAGGNRVFTCIPTTPPTCRADRGAFFNPLEARCDCQTGWENVQPDPSAADTFMCMRIAEADCDSTRGAIDNPNYGAAGASQCQCANGFRNLQTETANGGVRYFCEFDPNPTTPVPTNCDAAVNLTLNAQRTACECVAGHRDLEGRVPPEACAPLVALCDITKGAFPTGLGTSCACAPGYHRLVETNTPQTCTARCDDDSATLNSVSGQCECKEGFSDPRLERTASGTIGGIGGGLLPRYDAAELDLANLSFVCAPTTAPRPVCDESRNAIYSAKHNTCVCRVGPSGAGRPEFGLERKFDSSTNEYYCETANYLTGREGRLCDPSEGSHTNPLVYANLRDNNGDLIDTAPCVCDVGYLINNFSEGPARGASGVVPPGLACTVDNGQFAPRPRTELPVCSADKGTRLNADRNNCECIPGYSGNPLTSTGCIPANIPQTSVADCDAASAQLNPRNSRECQCKPGFFNLKARPAFQTLDNGLQVQTPRYFCSSAQEIQAMVSPNPGFSGADCTAAGFGAVVSNVRYRLPGVTNPVDGQREVCNIDWAEVSADNVPELSDGTISHVPPANTVNEGTSCVIQQFYKSGENYVSVPLPTNSNLRYCSDLFGGPARAGSLTNISVYAEARAAEINGLTPGTTLVAPYQPSHRLYVATGGGLYTQNGLQINNVPFVIDFVEGFSGADCVRDLTDGRNLGWRATLDLTQNGADRVFRLHCLVDWRETANPPPLQIEAFPPAGTAQGDRCLLGQQPADTPLAANERRCSDILASACEEPSSPLGCFALIYTALYDRIWQYNPILTEPETRDFPVVSPTDLPTFYISGGKVYNANGIESAGPLRFSPITSGFEPADCTRGGWRTQGDITRTSDGDYVLRQYCNVRWRRVTLAPAQGDVITPPDTITKQGERCLIRQSPPGITLAADLESCSELLGKAGTNFGAVGDEIDLLTEQANLGRAQNIPGPMRRGADTRGSDPLFILPDGRVFSQYGVGTPVLDFVGEVNGFTRDDCTNAGYRFEVRVTNTAAGDSLQLRTCAVPWARAASPPVLSANPARLSPSARLSLSSSGKDCVIEFSPARLRNEIPAGTERCSELLSPGGADFEQITARIEMRRAEINPLLPGDDIPAFTRNSTLIIADGRAFTDTGIEVRNDEVEMSAPATGYGVSDCEAGGWTAMTVATVVDNKPIIRQLCSVAWRESLTAPPFGGTPAPAATKMGDHCTIAHTDSTVTDLLECSDLLGRATGNRRITTFADITLRAEARRDEVNLLSSDSSLAGAYAIGVNTLYALQVGLFTDQGVEITDRSYEVSGAEDGWRFNDCTAARRTVGVTVVGAGLSRVVYQVCELNWARVANPPPLATMQAIPEITASGSGCVIASNPPRTTLSANLERCDDLFDATEDDFEAITVSLAAVRTAINELIDPVIPPLPAQALQTVYVVKNNTLAANNGVWSANGVGRGLMPFELPDGADNSGFQARDCTGDWAGAKRGRLSPSNDGTVFNLCNVKWRRTDAPPPILTEAAPVTLAATGRVKEAEFCVIAQRPSNATLPDGYELCTEAFAGRAGQANQNLAAITSQIEARRGEMNNPGRPINVVFPLPRTPNGIPAFNPASQTLQVVTGGGNARIFSPNGVEATDTRFSFTAAQNAAYGLDECRQGRFELSAQSTVVAGEQQVRIGCTMQWRRLADIPPLSPTALDDTLATSQNDHCVITQWPTNSAFAADSNNQYCGDLLSGIVPDFGEIFDRLQARVIDYNGVLSPTPANPATELFPTTTSARVRLFPYFFANNRMFNDRGVEITETAFSISDSVAAAFNQNRCNAAGLTLTFQSDVAGGAQRVRSVCGVRWAMAAAPLPVKEPPEPPTTASTSGDWCVIQQTPDPDNWPLPSNLVRCEDEFAAAGNLADVYRAHDALASTINTRWGAGLQTGDQRGKTLYLFGDTYYYPDGVDPRGAPPAPDYGTYTPEDCNTVYGAPEYLGAVVGTLQVLTRTCDVPWRTLADSPPPFAPVAATLALDNRAATSGEACVMALHPSSQAHPPNTIPCSDFEVGSPSFLDISNRIQQRVDQLNGLIFPQSLPDFDPTRPLYFYTGVNPSQLFNENGLQLTGDNFTPPYVGTPAVGFAMADCTAGGWNTGARLIAGGFAEVCEIRWRKTTTIPNIDKDAANLPAATSEGNLCVMRHTMTNPTLPEAAPWCSDLLSPVANSGGAFQNLKTRIDGRTTALNEAGAGIPAFDPTSHRVILAGTRAFSEHGAESVLPANVAVGLTTRDPAFDAAACSNTNVGHNLILHSEVSGANHILRQYCDVRWRSGSNVPPLAVTPANPAAAFDSEGDRCLMATRGTNSPLAGEMWCGGTGGLLSAMDNFRHVYERYGEWRVLMATISGLSLPPARSGGPELETGNYETFYHIPPASGSGSGALYTENGIPIRRAGLTDTDFVQKEAGSGFSIGDCTGGNLAIVTMAFNIGAANDLFIGRYCDVAWRMARTAPPLDNAATATSSNLPAPTSQGERCLIDQNPDAQSIPTGEQWCRDLFLNADAGINSIADIYAQLRARRLELNNVAAATADDFPEIPDGTEPLWIVGTPPNVFHFTGIKANTRELSVPDALTSGFSMEDCDNTFGAGKSSVRITASTTGQPVVQRICAVEWRRMGNAPGLSRAIISGPFTEQGSDCVLSQTPSIGNNAPLAAGQHLCSDLFGSGAANFAALESRRTSRVGEVNVIVTADDLPTYAAGANPYIVVENNNNVDVYDVHGVPIRSAAFVTEFKEGPIAGTDWNGNGDNDPNTINTAHDQCGGIFSSRAPSLAPVVDIVAGGLVELCGMKWRRVDSAPPLTPTRGLNPGEYPPLAAAGTRKEGDHCVIRATHDSLADLPNNLDFCSTLLNGGDRYTGFQNIFSTALFDVGQSLSPAFPGINVGFLESSAIPHFIFGNRIFNHRGIEWGGDYTQQGATTNWPTSTRTTRTTICGTNPSVSAVGRAEGQNVIVSCPTPWRTIPDGMVTSIDNDKLDPNLPGQTAAGDYCILSQSAPATAETTARRCDTIFGDVGGGIQRLVDAAIRSHGYVNAHLNTNTPANPIPTTPAATDIWWLNSTATFSPYGVKLQGAQNVDYVLSAVQDDFDAEDCVRAKWKTSISPPALFGARLSTIQGLQQGCTAQIAIAPTPPPLGTTPNPPVSSLQRTCEIARTPGVGPRTGFDDSCSTLLSGNTDFSDVIAKAEARRTQINALIPGTIPAFSPEANHTLYLVTTGAARGLYTGYGVPVMDNLRLTSPLGNWTAESCTAAGYTLGGRISNGNLYQTCSVGGGIETSKPPDKKASSFTFSGSVFGSCIIARTPGATLGANEHLCSALLGAPNLGNFANFQEIVDALEARRAETNLIRPGTDDDADRYDPAGYQSEGGLAYTHPLIIVQTGASAGIYAGTGVKADKQSAYVAQQPGFTIADCTAAGWAVKVESGYVQCEMDYRYVNTPPPLSDNPSPPSSTNGRPDCNITTTRGLPLQEHTRCHNVLSGTSGFQDAITKFNARRDEYNAVFDPDIPAFDFDSTVYVVQTGAGAGAYTQHGLRATNNRLFAPVTGGFTPEDCTAAGYGINVNNVGGNNFVSCGIVTYTVPNKPALGSTTNLPGNPVAETGCGITQTPGANPDDALHPTCTSLLGDHVSTFSEIVSKFEARRTEYNGVIDPDIPVYEPRGTNGIVFRVASGADAGLYTRNGIQASDSSIFDAVAGDFTIEDCTASGHRLNVNRNPNTGDVSVNCVMIVWTVDTKPPLANPATPPARPGNTNQESGCRITQTPGSPPLFAGSFTCAQLLGAHVSSFSQMTDRFTARRGEYNDFNAPNNIPNYVPWDGASSNVDSILYRVVSGADAGLYSRHGLHAHNDDSLPIPQLFDPNIDTPDCAAGGRTATQRNVGGVQIAECSGRFNMGADRPPYMAFNPGNNTFPTGGTNYEKCAYAAFPKEGALPTDTIKCNDLLSPATSGIADFSELLTRYGERRNDLFHPTANSGILKPHNTGSGFDRYRATQITYSHGGKLYFHNGIEIRDAAYTQAAESGSGRPGHEEGGFTAADCTAAGYSVSTTDTLSYDGIRWPVNICTARYIQRSAGDVPPAQNNEKAYPDAEHQTRSESGCYLSMPAPNIRAENRTWTTRRCQFLYGVGTSFTNLKARAEEVKNNFNRTISGSAAVPSHPQADPWIIQLQSNTNTAPTRVYSIYGLRIDGRRASHISEPNPLDEIFTGGMENFGRQDCLDAGWKLGETNDNAANDLHEICNILWRRRTTVAPTPPTTPTPPEEQSAAAAASSPGALGFQDEFRAAPVFSSPSPLAEDDIAPQTHEGKPHDYCITRHAKISSAPPPSDMQCGNVFAQHGGFPRLTVIQKAATDRGLEFDPTADALSIDENGKVILVKEDESGKMIEVPIPKPLGASPATPASSGGGGGGGGGAAIGIGVGSAAILGLLAYSLQSGAVGAGAGLGEFNWSPDISFAYNNTGMREIRYGTRMDFRHTDWHIWWTASQINSSGETKKMRYGSGAQYSADWWSARYNNSIHDKEARADVALKATGEFRDWGGVWKFSPTYRANVEVDEYNVQTWSHRVNLEAVWRINKWTLTQSTGFTAKKASDIGETLQTRLKLTREF